MFLCERHLPRLIRKSRSDAPHGSPSFAPSGLGAVAGSSSTGYERAQTPFQSENDEDRGRDADKGKGELLTAKHLLDCPGSGYSLREEGRESALPSMARATSTLTFCTWMSSVRSSVPDMADRTGDCASPQLEDGFQSGTPDAP